MQNQQEGIKLMDNLYSNTENINVTITHSGTPISDEIIYGVMDVERNVFKPEDRGTRSAIMRRMEKYPEMLILAEVNTKIVGYLCYFPISEKLFLDITDNGNYRDDDIPPEDVVPFSSNTHLFIISAAIYPEYQNRGIVDAMMNYLSTQVQNKCADGYSVSDITTIAISPDGERLATRYGFHLHFGDNPEYKVYKKLWGNLK